MAPAVARETGEPAEAGVVPAVVKAVAVIRRLDASAPAGAGLAELAAGLGLSRSHCHNILRTLVACGWVEHVVALRVYRLRPALLADIASLLRAGDQPGELRPFLVRLAGTLGLSVILSRQEPDGGFTVVDKVEGAAALGVTVPVGSRFPPDAPVQRKAALAWQGEAEIARWLEEWRPVAYTARSLTDKRAMARELALTRRRGHARSVGEFMDAVMSIGLPIYDRAGRVVLVLQCPGLLDQMRPREAEVAAALRHTVAEIHAFGGGRPPPGFPGGATIDG
jgi:DNA-binding IclR family transcriptional regulator